MKMSKIWNLVIISFLTLSLTHTFPKLLTQLSNNSLQIEPSKFIREFRESLSVSKSSLFGVRPATIVTSSKLLCSYNVPRLDDQPYAVFPEAINASLCTHLIVCCAQVKNLTLIPDDINDTQFYNRAIRLKKSNPKLKVMLDLQSVNDLTGQDFVDMISTSENRTRFISNAVKTLNQYGFDGLQISWKYPCSHGPPEQKELFSTFVKEFKDYITNSSFKLLLSAAVPVDKQIIDTGYDVKALELSLDFVSLMSYDYHTFTWLSPVTGPNAPLQPATKDIGYLSRLNVAWSANYWYENGMPRDKIIVGVPSYGRSYTLMNPNDHVYYDLAKNVGKTGQEGYVAYPEICTFIRSSNATLAFDNITQTPYVYQDLEWISYESVQSAGNKANWIMQNGYGGVAVQNLNSDDAYMICSNKTERLTKAMKSFPITQAIYDALFP